MFVAAAAAPASVSLDLAAPSDSGVSDADNITNVSAPDFEILVDQAGQIDIDFDGDSIPDVSQAVDAEGVHIFTAPVLADGLYRVSAAGDGHVFGQAPI